MCLYFLWFCVGEDDGRDLEKLEEKVWDPTSSLTEKQIDQFLVVAR